jgi:hypothetical protein
MFHYLYKNKNNDDDAIKDKDTKYIKELDLCFICFQLQNGIEKNSKKMNCIKKYNKTCECDAFIHVCCLDNWYSYHNDCPICRNTIEQKHFLINPTFNVIHLINNTTFLKYVYYFCTILKCIMYALLLIFIYGFYGTILYYHII